MGIGNKIRSAFRARSQGEIERDYLDQSISRFDLERREREIDQGLLRPRRPGF